MHPAHILSVALLSGVLAAIPAAGAEIRSRQASLVYDRPEQLRQFNSRVRLSGGFFSFGSGSGQIDRDVSNKLDRFASLVQTILDMRPDNFRYRVVLLDSAEDVDRVYQQQYGMKRDFIAFFSPKTDTIYISTADVDRNVFAHELAHAVIHHYFHRAPPTKIHELLAQYVESQI
ncbi:hypothetical protein EDC39_107134 [Geothermobacter ehrlichii]|uniref:DUF1570 domain-containing protein n=1 Tax=Geothermobacter ehrlichii TaxID=213224 RepID=A0A5D3WLF2_9BACT|nr:hypothetical protein [Geothermobacter ehrlichii]TYO98333.1 hypothetical protein EDC39_107134 [Geothermobacter ehrlichii]